MQIQVTVSLSGFPVPVHGAALVQTLYRNHLNPFHLLENILPVSFWHKHLFNTRKTSCLHFSHYTADRFDGAMDAQLPVIAT